MMIAISQIRESLALRWQVLPEVTVGLPILSLVLVSVVWGVQQLNIPGDASGWLAMIAGGMLTMNVLSPLGFHLRRIGKVKLGRVCTTTLNTIPFAMGMLALVMPRSI